MRALLALALVSLIFGCLSQAPPAAYNQTVQNQSAPPLPPQPSWDHFSGVAMAFDYPHGMKVTVSNSSMPSSGTVLVQSSDASQGAIVVNFANVSGALTGTEDPLSLATGIIDYENSSGSDAMLSQASATGSISNYTSPNGLAVAEMPFVMTEGNVTLYGFALELLSVQDKASYPTRIISSDPNQTKALRDRFVSSFQSG